MDAKRDWGYAPEYVEGMWRIMQQDNPDDYVLATGKTNTVRKFVEIAFKELDMELEWSGSGVDEVGIEKNTRVKRVLIDPKYFRPTEVDLLLGDASKAASIGWKPKTSFEQLVKMMVNSDWEKVKKRGF